MAAPPWESRRAGSRDFLNQMEEQLPRLIAEARGFRGPCNGFGGCWGFSVMLTLPSRSTSKTLQL